MRVGNHYLFEAMSTRVQSWLLHDFDPQHLSNVLWSYAKLAVRDVELFEAAAGEIVQRGLDHLCRAPQNISNTVWAYGVVGVKPPAFMKMLESHIMEGGMYYSRLTEVRPLTKSSRAQLAMMVISLHRLGLHNCAWHLFDRIAADGLQAGGEAYCNWLLICGDTGDMKREIDVWEQMALTSHTRGLQAGVWNCVIIRSLAAGDTKRALLALQALDNERLCTPMSEHLRERADGPPPRNGVGEIEWRRREKEEHEWVTNSLGFSLRLNKIEYYKEVGTMHYTLGKGRKHNIPSIHKGIETFIK